MRRLLWLCCLLAACAAKQPIGTGTASWYGKELAGRPTASGDPFRPSQRTCAHRTLPFGTVLRVERVDTGERVRVVVNDRGPFVGGRIVDLSRGAARKLDMIDQGTAKVTLTVVGCRDRWGRCP